MLAMLRMDRGRFIREVKRLADGRLVEIDDDTGNLLLTGAGSRKVAEDELPPPEPVTYEAKVPQPAPLSTGAAPQPGPPGSGPIVTPRIEPRRRSHATTRHRLAAWAIPGREKPVRDGPKAKLAPKAASARRRAKAAPKQKPKGKMREQS
ncbi:hypothetical protein FHP25_08510 [Vineibacter terrae]|uniref:Uncharacterized protein n=1 Tax=Vineibacter terrae TaxID=2586908 RepID=A0A5C8PSH3_9HYPH|nr:hypothetical protein [Vineibacter terrae]TXL78229.1 hypothetical protein FHP25_08510 [Vineibacter terrae]